ncbi:hypothetical protein DEO72_LG8g831 [Vigna unguiculata]|uniref:Disease resistance protein At4g27190-like leucine-rich repeats domain-containing protein n=1 Tax=Vigna unguiculata TaxID=3917 RepID=A0A4D6MMU8_VIGUN|nr:hypothetical protein DEO72_LG8g831 [Vigna unguiculata]
MSLGKEEVMMIEQGKLQIDLPKLSSLKLQCFDDEQVDFFPFVFGSKVSLSLPTIKKLGFLHCAFKEIFPAQAPGIDCTKILSQLKTLECHCLTNLTPSTVSFSNLIKLNVKDPRKLKYLFTSSTTKTLVVLKEIYITNCKSLKTIVVEDRYGGDLIEDNEVEEEGEGEGNEDDDDVMDEGQSDGNEDENKGVEEEEHGGGKDDIDKDKDNNANEVKANATVEGEGVGDANENAGDGDNDNVGNECEDGITFKNIERLTLRSLPKLRSFYTGSSTLNFLSLEEVSFSKCCTAKLLRLRDKVPKKLRMKIDECKRDMNSVFMQQDEPEAS